jgi:hypothetical protein
MIICSVPSWEGGSRLASQMLRDTRKLKSRYHFQKSPELNPIYRARWSSPIFRSSLLKNNLVICSHRLVEDQFWNIGTCNARAMLAAENYSARRSLLFRPPVVSHSHKTSHENRWIAKVDTIVSYSESHGLKCKERGKLHWGFLWFLSGSPSKFRDCMSY